MANEQSTYIIVFPVWLFIGRPQGDPDSAEFTYQGAATFQSSGVNEEVLPVFTDESLLQTARKSFGIPEYFSSVAFYTKLGFAEFLQRALDAGVTDMVLDISENGVLGQMMQPLSISHAIVQLKEQSR
jgi:hypothetical protein